MPNEDIWPKILGGADEFTNDATLSTRQMFRKYKNDLLKRDLKSAIYSKNIDNVDVILHTVNLDKRAMSTTAIKVLKRTFFLIENEFALGNNIKPEAIARYVDVYLGNLIVEINNNTKLAIRELIINGWNNEILPKDLYNSIKDSGIGLDPRRQRALQRYFYENMSNEILRSKYPNEKDFMKELMRLNNKEYTRLLNSRCKCIGRTECIDLANEGSRIAYEEAAMRNKELHDNYILAWITTPDDLLCEKCGRMHMKTCEWGGTFDGGYQRPTLHPRCLLPGSTCKAPGGDIAIIRQMFSGEAIKFTIANGTQISVTPDHMFLTPNGWAAAKLLRKGDNIIYCPTIDKVSNSPNNNRGESTIENIFNTLAITCGMSTGIMPTASENLNGNWWFDDSNVDIVRTDGFLRNTIKSPIDKHITNFDLERSRTAKGFLACDSTFTSSIDRLRNSSDCSICGSRESSSFFRGRLGHSQEHSFAFSSLDNSILIKDSDNNRSSTIEFFRENLNGIPGIIELNEIIAIDSSVYHGYVYDVQSISTLLICNGILTSNCRCCIVCIPRTGSKRYYMPYSNS